MAITIVVANRKGGSSKTTSTINIADGLARQKRCWLLMPIPRRRPPSAAASFPIN